MPELPEVETIVRQLGASLPGLRIGDVRIAHPDLIRETPQAFREALNQAEFTRVSRRGKNIVLDLSGPQVLLVNLGMTGQLLFVPDPPGPGRGSTETAPSHLALVFTLEPRGSLLYADTRRFGCLRRYSPTEWERESARLGPEPLDPVLTPESFHQLLARSRSPIRSWMLDQTRIAGIGNIYASEALFRAGIHPKRSAQSLSPGESMKLLDAVREVLSDAIRARGTTLRDYRTASGEGGDFGPSLQAYGKEGVSCSRCNTAIERIVFAKRSAFYCPSCQREA